MQFPLDPFLDRVIVEVIPIEKYFRKPENIEVLLDRDFSQRSDRGVVRSVGPGALGITVGEVVQFDPDTAFAGLIYLNPGDKLNPEAPTYLELRVGDLLGRVLAHERELTEVCQ